MRKWLYKIAILIVLLSKMAIGGIDACIVKMDELNGKEIQADFSQIIHYDFSGVLDSSQVIKRIVVSISGSFKPGIGYYDGEYGPLGSSDIIIYPFDNYISYQYQFPDEASTFDIKIDSEEMIGWKRLEFEMPYSGYSGDKAGEFGFYFAQSQTLSTIIETWPTIEITEATYTIYVVPEPATLLLLSCGIFFMKRRASK